MSEHGYVNLIRHLTRSSSTLSLQTLQASIAHYLALPPTPVPGTPTPLAAAVLGSPLFRPYAHSTLAVLSLAFRHAVHLRVGVLKVDAERNPSGFFSRDPCTQIGRKLGQWCREAWEGFVGGAPLVRIACAAGLLLGLEDWEAELKLKDKEARLRAKAEEEVVLALAEVIDAYAPDPSGWSRDFRRTVEARGDSEDPLALAISLMCHCAPLVAPQRLQALPLNIVLNVLVSTIHEAFGGGVFLASHQPSMGNISGGKLSIASTSAFSQRIQSIAGSTYIVSMPSFAKFTSIVITNLVESRPIAGWEAAAQLLQRFKQLAVTLEKDWARCPLAELSHDTDFADDATRDVASATWSILKTILFTTLMLSQSVLSAVVFVPNPQDSPGSTMSPYAIALEILHTLSHLSFIMPQFGGVASTSEGLPELKRAFYMALDVLSESQEEACRFVEELHCADGASGKGKGVDTLPVTLLRTRRAFTLACVEQLVSVLPEAAIQGQVYPLCFPHLWDPSHRETYESAHSVMLAVFSSHARNQRASTSQQSTPGPVFAEKSVPMYARCLVENSPDGRLSTTQLCLAYSALVQSASAFRYGTSSQPSDDGDTSADSLVWYCIEVLLNAIRDTHTAHASKASSSEPSQDLSPRPSEHQHRLHLTLVATVASVSLTLLPRLLAEVHGIIMSLISQESGDTVAEMREELIEALFKVISQEVGDAEKPYAIEWWQEHRDTLVGEKHSRGPTINGLVAAQPSAPENLSRL